MTVDRLILDSLRIISDSTQNIGHHEDDVALKKEIVDFSKIVCRDYPQQIYKALCEYAAALATVDRISESTEVYRETLKFSENNFDANSNATLKILRILA